MTRLRIVGFKTMERLLLRLGFPGTVRTTERSLTFVRRVRQKGSHVFYRHPDGRTTTLPDHAGRDLARPLIREVLREIELTPERFEEELRRL